MHSNNENRSDNQHSRRSNNQRNTQNSNYSYGSHSRQIPATYSSESDLIRVRKKKKNKKGIKVVVIALVVLVALIGGGFALAAGYYNSLASSIAYEGDMDSLNDVLIDANYQEPFYVLVIGSDNWESYGARSDAMLLTRVDLNTTTVTMVSVPRDTPYEINGQTVKLNEVYSQQGEIACIEAVSEITGVPISHYVEIEFDQLEGVVDSLGGILVDVPYAIDYTVYTQDQPTVHIDAGTQVLNGEQAVALARMRTAYDEAATQDAVRQANIRAMMVAMIKDVLDSPINEIPGNIQTLVSMLQTDIPMDDVVDWAIKFSQAPEVTLYSCTGPYQGGVDEETELWLTYEAPESWQALMSVVDAGEDPTGVLTENEDGGVALATTESLVNKDETSTENDPGSSVRNEDEAT